MRSFHSVLLGSVLSVFLYPLAAFGAQAAAWQWIDGQRVMDKMKEGTGFWLIDVRNSAAYEDEHIEGSVNIPVPALAHKQFPAQKTIILVDDALGDKNAREAADKLVKKGQERVSVLEGGIAGWKIEGLPLVERPLPAKEQGSRVRGVTAAEVKWALAQKVPFRLYDLRSVKVRTQEPLRSSEPVAGKTTDERVEKLRTALSGAEKRKDLAARINKKQQIVLVFSASDDGEGYTRKIVQSVNSDVRYLIGGYEAMISDRIRGQQTTGDCPTCPGGKRK